MLIVKKEAIFTKLNCALFLLSAFVFTSYYGYSSPGNTAKMQSLMKSASIHFTENRGQVVDVAGKPRPDILFSAHSNSMHVFLTATGIYYQFAEVQYPEGYGQDPKDIKDFERQAALASQIQTRTYRFSLALDGANPHPAVRKENKNVLTENFYLAHCPDGVRNVATWQQLTYENVYPGIDWVLYSKGNSLKYDFVVHPGANPAQIRLRISDAQGVSITQAGELLMKTPMGEVREQAPVSYAGGQKINSRFKQNSDGSIGFEVGAVPAQTILTIDPSVTWATYFGGSGTDQGNGCAVDGSGNIYISGITASTSSIATTGALQTTPGGGNDGFIAKFSSSGTALWATYYGGSGTETAIQCATDNSGNVFISGYTTSSSAIATTGAYQTTLGGTQDAFLVKLNSSGSRLWGTYFGGAGVETYGDCATDASGNVFLSGITASSSGIATTGAYQSTLSGTQDLYLAKFNSSGSILWGTYFGGSGSENVWYNSCSADPSGNVFLGGYTNSASGIATSGAYQTTFAGATDGFVSKFSSSGSLLWATYLGGSGTEGFSSACTADAFGNVYFAIACNSTSGVATTGAFQTANGGGYDACIAKFTSAGTMRWCTYYGGSGNEVCYGVTTDPSGNVFVGGYTTSMGVIASSGAFQSTIGGGTDAFAVKFDSTGARQWGSYFGGTGTDECIGICNNGSGNIFMAGYTSSATGIATTGAYQTTVSGTDAFLNNIQDVVAATITTGTITGSPLCAGATVNVPFTITGTYTAGNVFTAQLSDASGSFTSPVSIGTLTGVSSGTVTATIPVGATAGAGYRIRVVSSTPVVSGTDNGVNLTIATLPSAGTITGTATVCALATTTLSDATTGGVWSSGATGVATVGSTGIVTGASAGTATVSYAVTNSCGTAYATDVVTVNPLPSAGTITGIATACALATTALSDATTGGIWSSGATGVATVGSTGVVTGVSAGVATISYAVTNSCGAAYATDVVTVNPLPSAGTITGTATVCALATTTLSDATGGGIWSSGVTGVATVGSTGVVTGVSAGTAAISYAVTNSCGTAYATDVVTVNPLPSAGMIAGADSVCALASTTLSDVTIGGVWGSSVTGVATVGSTGIVTGVSAGTATISYTVTNSCGADYATAVVTVNPLPLAGTITGIDSVCPLATTTLGDATTGGVWSGSATGVATIDSTGMVTGVSAGTTTISYAVTNSCGTAYTTAVVTVDPLPLAGAISGIDTVCALATTILNDAAAGGIWSSGATGIATVGSTGIVTGVSAGTATISYAITNGCGTDYATATVTVNPLPSAGIITGIDSVCALATTALSDTITGGIWSSGAGTIAAVDTAGIVTGVSAGTATISYAVTNGCGTAYATAIVTVNSLPSAGIITGIDFICAMSIATLSDAVTGGVWSSSTPAVAIVGSTGVVTGVSAGVATISYAVANSCGTAYATHAVTINALPVAGVITGAHTLCAGTTTALSDTTPGGTWSSSDASIAVVSGGLVSGVARGSAIITYTVANSCSAAIAIDTITVSAPSVYMVTGGGRYCAHGTGVHIGLSGSDTGVWYQLYAGATAIGAPVAGTGGALDFGLQTGMGIYHIVAMDSVTTCSDSMTGAPRIDTNALPTAYMVTGGGSFCAADTGVHIHLSHSDTGSNYQLIMGGSAIGLPLAGNGFSLDYGPLTMPGYYIIVATNSHTGCANTMTDSVRIVVDTLAYPAVVISVTPAGTLLAGASDTFQAHVTSTGGGTIRYQWVVNGSYIAGATSATYITSALTGNDSVVCLVIDSNSCGFTITPKYLNVHIHDVGVQITTISNGNILLIPNPNSGMFIIKGILDAHTDEQLMLEVTNMLGQSVYKRTVRVNGGAINEDIQLDNSVANGVYLLRLGQDKVFRFVVNR